MELSNIDLKLTLSDRVARDKRGEDNEYYASGKSVWVNSCDTVILRTRRLDSTG